ncbi:MAG TPA: metal-dependent hydrolase [Polyangia bacterium]
MASIGHVIVGLAARSWYAGESGAHAVPSEATRAPVVLSMALWSGLSLLPDADVIAFSFGIPYAAPWGHRGATHSFAFAALMGLLGYLVARAVSLPPLRTGFLVAVVVASHAVLDTLTDGGLGCALLWPLSDERFFAPWRPLPVAPIGAGFVSLRGLRVAVIELLFFAVPLIYALWPRRRPAINRRVGPHERR